ncbi:hypothetical protein AMECASPLE_010858 [Ameca splendens]|uniref:Uncharacterized protein n=1 Tax=Ameca splendens TaxID=208324 RepID=A0ABV0YN27_9TELE
MVVGGVVCHGVYLTALLPLVVLVCLSMEGLRVPSFVWRILVVLGWLVSSFFGVVPHFWLSLRASSGSEVVCLCGRGGMVGAAELLPGVELICVGVPLWGGDSWHLGSGACVRYLHPGWGWLCGVVHVGGSGVSVPGPGSIELGLGLLPFWISLGTPSNVGPISSLPHFLPVAGVSIGDCRCLGLGDLVCRQGLRACRRSSLGVLHCGCWVAPLGLSSALLWGGCGRRWSSRGSDALGGFWMSVAQIFSMYVLGRGAQHSHNMKGPNGNTRKSEGPSLKNKVSYSQA